MTKKILSTFALLAVPTALTMAQEGYFADYLQPMRSFTILKNDFSSSVNIGTTVTSDGTVSLEMDGGNQICAVSGNGQSGGNYLKFSAFQLPSGGAPEFVEFDFDVKSENGVFSNLAIFSEGFMGSQTNGGLITLPSSSLTQYVHIRCRVAFNGFELDNTKSLSIAPIDLSIMGGGSYNSNAKLRFDNLRITFPKRLTGVSRVTGTTDKNIGTITFSNDGTTLGTYKDWIQNIGNVKFLDVFGRTNFGFDSDAKSSSNLLVSRDNGSYNSLALERFSNAFDSISNAAWIGTSILKTGDDRYYGISADADNFGQQYLLRQNETSGVYRHTIRCLSNSFYYGNEMDLDLGGEALVAVGDFNGDGKDDLMTRSGQSFKLRTFTGNSGTNPNRTITLSAPITVLSNAGTFRVDQVEDINGDGKDDLLMTDSQSDVFIGLCSGTAITPDWIFALNDMPSDAEHIIALTDADNDGLPEIYTTRANIFTSEHEVDIRKISLSNPSNAQISSYTRLAYYDFTVYEPCAVGDINGDGAADVVMASNGNFDNQLATFLTNPATRTLAGNPHWIAYARGSYLRPIFK